MAVEERSWETPFNVVAAFPRADQAEDARRLLVKHGIPADAVAVATNASRMKAEPAETASLRAEMQEEISQGWFGLTFFMTASQAKGAFWGTALFTAVGVLAGLIGGLIWIAFFSGTLAPGWRLFIAVAIGAVAGGTIGFLAGGSFEPRIQAAGDPDAEMEDPRPAAERDVIVVVNSDRQDVAERAAELLGGCGAERVDRADETGTPLPPQAAHPRPADPPGWWWRRAGRG